MTNVFALESRSRSVKNGDSLVTETLLSSPCSNLKADFNLQKEYLLKNAACISLIHLPWKSCGCWNSKPGFVHTGGSPETSWLVFKRKSCCCAWVAETWLASWCCWRSLEEFVASSLGGEELLREQMHWLICMVIYYRVAWDQPRMPTWHLCGWILLQRLSVSFGRSCQKWLQLLGSSREPGKMQGLRLAMGELFNQKYSCLRWAWN